MPQMNILYKKKKENKMGKLVIDGNSFFEIDEECIKKKNISKKCGLDKYLKDKNEEEYSSDKKTKKKS